MINNKIADTDYYPKHGESMLISNSATLVNEINTSIIFMMALTL